MGDEKTYRVVIVDDSEYTMSSRTIGYAKGEPSDIEEFYKDEVAQGDDIELEEIEVIEVTPEMAKAKKEQSEKKLEDEVKAAVAEQR